MGAPSAFTFNTQEDDDEGPKLPPPLANVTNKMMIEGVHITSPCFLHT